MNESAARPDAEKGILVLSSGGKKPVRTKYATYLPRVIDFAWDSIEGNKEVLAVLATSATRFKLRLSSRTADLKTLFRHNRCLPGRALEMPRLPPGEATHRSTSTNGPGFEGSQRTHKSGVFGSTALDRTECTDFPR